MSNPTLYDLFWVCPIPLGADEKLCVAPGDKTNTFDILTLGIPAAILYPALLTPDVLVGDSRVELLLVVRDQDKAKLTKEIVNRQLKVSKGLKPIKPYSSGPLFSEEVEDKIAMKELGALGPDKIATETRFSGIVNKHSLDLYKSKNFTVLFSLSLDNAMLKCAEQDLAFSKNKTEMGKVVIPSHDNTNQDYWVHEAIKNEAVENKEVKWSYQKGQYAFKVEKNDINLDETDNKNPIQSFHPVFHFENLDYANIGHMSDLHVSSRQKILAKSKARVIEGEHSKPIGEMVNICSEDTKTLLNKFGTASDVDVVVMGGDLVDFITNTYRPGFESLSSAEIWKTVDMEDRQYYIDNIDFLTMYAFVVDFYQNTPKPTYVVTGNHDCYYDPYGISPRVAKVKRANEGIPADHNLTIYEAIVAFGPSYGKLTKLDSSFDAEKFEWFYTVYTPFSEYSLQLPNQYLVGLGWGDDEKMISMSRPSGHGLGHLPRANKAISDTQLDFLKTTAVDKNDGRKIILTTHFTFVSYLESISLNDAANSKWGNSNDEGDVYFTNAWYSTRDFSEADMGTFEKNREALYNDLIGKGRKLQLILTGHSHRRGFYTAREVDTSGNNSVKTGYHDFPDFNGDGTPVLPNKKDKKEPWIIVSDSGGSIPRYNKDGEFKGWGSSPPAGTQITFNTSGKVDAVKVISTGVKPRIVVALDYMDIFEEDIISKFKTHSFISGVDQKPGWRYTFELDLLDEIKDKNKYGLSVDTIKIYSHSASWKEISLERVNNKEWQIPEKQNKTFSKRFLRLKTKRGLFMAMNFSSSCEHLKNRYDFSTPWTFETNLVLESNARSRYSPYYYIAFRRDNSWRDIPDLEGRKQAPEHSKR